VVCSNAVYEQRMTEALASEPLRDVGAVAFGDLFLEDIRAYREGRLATVAKQACFPLWHRDTAALARENAGPIFQARMAIEVGELVERDGFVFSDITTATQ
jgi:diphthamide synthase (EF-2-diphthine--ammonia ligase)